MNKEEYYKKHSDMSTISKKFANMFPDAPKDIMAAVRKKIVHPCECPMNFDATNWPRVKNAREIEKTFLTQNLTFGICRRYTLACVAIMRSKGIPARSRCGFAIYLKQGAYEDHWVIEYMDKGKWVLADAQKMMFDIKPGQFINGAVAWQLVRQYNFDPALFGFFGHHEMGESGLHYVIGNMIRDASGLLKCELNYGDLAKIIGSPHNITNDEVAFYDSISQMVLDEDLDGLQKALGAYGIK